MDLLTIINKVRNIHEAITIELYDIHKPRANYTPAHELVPIDLAGGETTLTETLPVDGETPPLLTQLPYKYLPLVYALE